MSDCCLYWIRAKDHTDIFTEGYVGITIDFDYRLSQHINNCNNPKQYKNYRTAFREAVNSGNYVATKVIIGTRSYCLDVEAKLRPSWKLGWNLAKGGSGGYGKHGLTGTKVKRDYYNMLTRADAEGQIVDPVWLGEKGLTNFKKFYDSITTDNDGFITLKQPGYGYSPDNLIIMSKPEIVSRVYRTYDVDDGRLYTVNELGDKFNLKPNTISTRISRGWTVREAVGLDSRQKGFVCLPSGACAKYNGKYRVEQIEGMKKAYESGETTTKISKEFHVDVSNLLRLANMFGFDKSSRCIRFKDFFGEDCELNLRTVFTEELIEKFKLALLDGKTASQITKDLQITVTAVYNLKDILRWKEYERTMGNTKHPLER